MKRKIHMVIDGQFGSTGKGLLAGYLAKDLEIDTICTAWGSNSGHTLIDSDGRKYVHTMLANGIVGKNVRRVLLGAGSVIDPDNLQAEYEQCKDIMHGKLLAIHPHAAIITQQHRDEEAGPMTKIGSTKKGCGAAAIHRIRRDPDNMNVAKSSNHPFIRDHVVTEVEYQMLLEDSKNILVEGAQGYSLSMYHGMYPFTTSRDVSTHQVLADCCIPWNFGEVEVYGCYRTYPIRVANRFDGEGRQVGYSGGCYSDQKEIDWKDLGIEPEFTTVTKLPRRIFTFSRHQYYESVRMLGVNKVFLNFVNYLPDQISVAKFVDDLDKISDARICYIGVGPRIDQVLDRETFAENEFKSSLGKA